MSPHKERKGSPHKENSLDIVKTRCTRGDARSFFCTYKTYLYAKFSQKTSVSNVNVSNDNFVCLKLAPRIRCET